MFFPLKADVIPEIKLENYMLLIFDQKMPQHRKQKEFPLPLRVERQPLS